VSDSRLGCNNAFLTKDGAVLSIGSSVVRQTRDRGLELLRTFPGASRGVRSLFVARDGSIFASPEGTQLPDSEKGLWRSADRGRTWQRVLDLSGAPNPVAIWGLDADQKGCLYAGVYTTAPGARMAVIYASSDCGEHWRSSYADLTGRHIHSIAVDSQTRVVYATVGDDFGIWKTRRIVRSDDCGYTWQPIISDLPQVVPVVAAGKARLFGSDFSGRTELYRTTDDEKWTTVLSEPESLYFFWIRSDADAGRLLAGTVTGRCQEQARVYQSLDEGRSWNVFQRLDAPEHWDGTPCASNIQESKIIILLRARGTPQPPLVVDLDRRCAVLKP